MEEAGRKDSILHTTSSWMSMRPSRGEVGVVVEESMSNRSLKRSDSLT